MIATETLLLGMAAAGLLIGVISLILAIRANAKYKKLYRQYDYFMRGKDAETLEDYFVDLQKHVEALEEEDAKNKDVMRVLNKSIRSSFSATASFAIMRSAAWAAICPLPSLCWTAPTAALLLILCIPEKAASCI